MLSLPLSFFYPWFSPRSAVDQGAISARPQTITVRMLATPAPAGRRARYRPRRLRFEPVRRLVDVRPPWPDVLEEDRTRLAIVVEENHRGAFRRNGRSGGAVSGVTTESGSDLALDAAGGSGVRPSSALAVLPNQPPSPAEKSALGGCV